MVGRGSLGAALVLCFSGPLIAAQFRMPAAKPKSITLPGTFVAFEDPIDNSLYTAAGLFGGEEFSIPAVLDTGASGLVLSQFAAGSGGILGGGLNIPTTGEVFEDVGFGGMESFDVSVSTRLLLAPIEVGEFGANARANYSSFDKYKFMIRQRDPDVLGLPVIIDIIGTPVINQYVMHVRPNVIPFTNIGLATIIDYMDTKLLPEMPKLKGQLALRVPLTYVNFIDDSGGAAPVSVARNPVIEGIRIMDDRKGPTEQSAPRDWIFDSGGASTLISVDYAVDIGIDLLNEVPVSEIQTVGIGNETPIFFGYDVDELVVPLAGGHELVLENPVVFVGELPANLSAIFGVNLVGQSFSIVDPLLGPADVVESTFSDWYVDPFGNELVLVPIDQTIPEPGLGLIALISAIVMARRVRR